MSSEFLSRSAKCSTLRVILGNHRTVVADREDLSELVVGVQSQSILQRELGHPLAELKARHFLTHDLFAFQPIDSRKVVRLGERILVGSRIVPRSVDEKVLLGLAHGPLPIHV